MDQQGIKKLAELAKLSLTDEELQTFEQEINAMVGLIDAMQTVETNDVEPTYRGIDLLNVLREDQPNIEVTSEQLMVNTPAHKDGYIQVPAIMNDGNEGA